MKTGIGVDGILIKFVFSLIIGNALASEVRKHCDHNLFILVRSKTEVKGMPGQEG